MNQSAEYDELLAIRWLRPLNDDECRRLEVLFAAEEGLRRRWEEEMVVLEGVEGLPDVPLSSNFTHAVVSQVASRMGESAVGTSAPVAPSWLERLGLLPRLGLGFALSLAVFGSFLQYQRGHSGRMVESLAAVTESDTVPSLEELQNFEAIQRLAQVPVEVDWELIAAVE